MTLDTDPGYVLHKWCQSSSLLPDKNSQIPRLKLTLLTAESDTELTKVMRQHDISSNKSRRKCSGNALWYHVGTQYFPAFTDVTAWPEVGNGRISYEDYMEIFGDLKMGGKDLETEIENTERKLADVKEKIRLIQSESKPRNSRKQALSQLQESLSDSYLILGELELLEHASTRSSYLAYLQSRQRNPTSVYTDPELPRKEYNCGVCQGGTSDDRNPIIICSVSAI